MKKLNLILGILIGFTILSCSSDNDSNDPESTMSELLIQGSPWTFDHYEMVNIIDAGNSNFTQTDIENDVNLRENGITLTFNQNGICLVTIPNYGTDNWNWEIANSNQLKLTFEGAYTNIFENLNVSSNQLIFEGQSVSYDVSVQYEVMHYGKYYYK